VVADGLARQTHLAEQAAVLEDLAFGLGHHLWLAFEVLNAAGRTLGVGAAAMQDVQPSILLYRKYQSLAFGNVEGSCALYF
jgi:hypothetical protein